MKQVASLFDLRENPFFTHKKEKQIFGNRRTTPPPLLPDSHFARADDSVGGTEVESKKKKIMNTP